MRPSGATSDARRWILDPGSDRAYTCPVSTARNGTALTAPLKIFHVAGNARESGAERLLLQMAAHLDVRAFRMAVALPSRSPLTDALKRHHIPVEILPLPFAVNPWSVRRLSRLFSEWKPDIVQGHGVRSNVYARLAAGGTPCVSTLYDTLDAHFAPHRWISAAVDVATSGRSAAVVCAAECVRRDFLERCPEMWERTHMIRPGVDLERFDPRHHDRGAARNGLNLGDRWTLMIAGRLIEKKGHAFILDALYHVRNTLPPFRLIIAGDGPQRKSLEKKAKARGLGENVVFLGTHNDIPALLSASDAVLVPSLREDVPNVLLEALAMGKPVVASQVGGITEIMAQEGEGWLVPPRSTDKFIEALLSALWNKEEARKRADTARRRIVQEYDLRKTIARWETLYREVSGDILIR